MFVKQGKGGLLAPASDIDEPPQVFKICSHMNHSKISKLVRPIVTHKQTSSHIEKQLRQMQDRFRTCHPRTWGKYSSTHHQMDQLGFWVDPGWPPMEGSYIQRTIQGAWYSSITTGPAVFIKAAFSDSSLGDLSSRNISYLKGERYKKTDNAVSLFEKSYLDLP